MKPVVEEQMDKEILLYDRDTECSVCFMYHLNDEAPDVTCDYESCRRQFHNVCLYEVHSISFTMLYVKPVIARSKTSLFCNFLKRLIRLFKPLD